MRPGNGGNLGNIGNVESVTYRPHYPGDETNLAIQSLIRRHEMDLSEIVIALNADLAGTRGCAMSIYPFR